MARNPDETAQFLNVDLDVVSKVSLEKLVAALEPGAFALHHIERDEGYLATFELGRATNDDADSTIMGLVELIRNLPAAAKTLWNKASERIFDIGIQSGARPRQIRAVLRPETVRAVADLKASIVVTVYAPIAKSRTRAKKTLRRVKRAPR